ncbi:Hypothetical predicted protein [Paramuricea clavata]|uniref:Uncharacterized protein n=1 Tax=Paramuricea clavata TaxID=317549 RepID=A0A6S7IXS7_PARCT|nr:Hypothetical predicted protein [Paramuricea clavata]
MIGYILFAIFVVAANANNARLSGWNNAAYQRQQDALNAQSGTIQGQYNEIPTDTYVSHWTNEVLAIARGATQITITNHNVNNVKIAVGYKGANSGSLSHPWWTKSGDLVEYFSEGGVQCVYQRTGQVATVLISGPANPVVGGNQNLNLIVGALRTSSNSGPGHITWTYTAN